MVICNARSLHKAVTHFVFLEGEGFTVNDLMNVHLLNFSSF